MTVLSSSPTAHISASMSGSGVSVMADHIISMCRTDFHSGVDCVANYGQYCHWAEGERLRVTERRPSFLVHRTVVSLEKAIINVLDICQFVSVSVLSNLWPLLRGQHFAICIDKHRKAGRQANSSR